MKVTSFTGAPLILLSETGSKRCCGPEGCGEIGNAGGRWCAGDRCMAWMKFDQVGIGPHGERRDRDLDGRTKWVDRGFCGLIQHHLEK